MSKLPPNESKKGSLPPRRVHHHVPLKGNKEYSFAAIDPLGRYGDFAPSDWTVCDQVKAIFREVAPGVNPRKAPHCFAVKEHENGNKVAVVSFPVGIELKFICPMCSGVYKIDTVRTHFKKCRTKHPHFNLSREVESSSSEVSDDDDEDRHQELVKWQNKVKKAKKRQQELVAEIKESKRVIEEATKKRVSQIFEIFIRIIESFSRELTSHLPHTRSRLTAPGARLLDRTTRTSLRTMR